MKTMKLALGGCVGMLALALVAGTAQAQASRVVRGGGVVTGGSSRGAAGGVTNTWHAIIYDHEVLAPAMPGRRLVIYDDGVIKLFDSAATPNPIGSGRLDASALASLRLMIGAAARAASSSAPVPGGRTAGSSAALALQTRLGQIAADLARNAVVVHS
jgi:hypothetical protein